MPPKKKETAPAPQKRHTRAPVDEDDEPGPPQCHVCCTDVNPKDRCWSCELWCCDECAAYRALPLSEKSENPWVVCGPCHEKGVKKPRGYIGGRYIAQQQQYQDEAASRGARAAVSPSPGKLPPAIKVTPPVGKVSAWGGLCAQFRTFSRF